MQTLSIKDNDLVKTVYLDRPATLNAFNNQLMDELTDVLLAAALDDQTHVLVLTGAGRAFSAGADLQEMAGSPERPKHGFAGLLDAILDFPKPLIVAVNGVGAGIGATICGLADVVYMSSAARLRCPFSTLGLTAEACSTYTFPRLMGRQRATWFLLSAQWMNAADCVAAGLALALCEPDELLPFTQRQALQLAKLPIASLVMTKQLIMQHTRDDMRAAARAENAGLASLLGGPANREALTAFQEKREPNFAGLNL